MSKDPVNPNKQRNYFYTPSHTPTASLPDFSSQTFTAFGTGHSAVFHTDSRAKKAVVVGASGSGSGPVQSRAVQPQQARVQRVEKPQQLQLRLPDPLQPGHPQVEIRLSDQARVI